MRWLAGLMDGSGWIWDAAIATVLCVGVSLLGALVAGIVLVRMPANYFCEDFVRGLWTDRHPLLRLLGHVLKNLLGACLIVLGGVMALPGVPGPGLLVMLFGVSLVDFPGKRRLERWLISRPRVLSAINRLRQRYGKPPVILEPSGKTRQV